MAPIVLFVYNRPWHTQQTLEALSRNEYASQSELFIYADGPKKNASDDTLKAISEVRKITRQEQWCGKVHIIESIENRGLANSIIKGVTEVVNEYGYVIVLEDDIVTSTGFLKYMNEALTLYRGVNNVFHISGYMFPVKGKLPATFFYKQTSCWGWATWKDRWLIFEHSPQKIMKELTLSGKIKEADIDGTNQFINQLQSNIDGSIKTWAVLWHFSVFLKNGLSLHPNQSLVTNIGFDNSGTHCRQSNIFNTACINEIKVEGIPVKENFRVYKLLKNFYRNSSPNNLKAAKAIIKSILPSVLKTRIKIIADRELREEQREYKRLRKLPRFKEAQTLLFGKSIKIADAFSYLFSAHEIFKQEIYRFRAITNQPVIIDCGANIGLSIIFFKHLYPKSQIIGFEPDGAIFNILQYNVKSFGLSNVELIKKACWNADTTLEFFSEGADGGRKATTHDTENNLISVDAVRLANFINREIDFLKIDIEGAEFTVLEDIQDQLWQVSNIFVEYHSVIGQEQMLPELLKLLKNAGFRLYISPAGASARHPFIKRPSYLNMDNQINIFGFRE